MLLFDVGANVGLWAIANEQNNRVICVEASPKTFVKLLEKTKKFSNIECINFAISNSNDCTVSFYDCKTCDVLSTMDKQWLTSPDSRFHTWNLPQEIVQVPTKSLDDLIHMYGLPDLLKIDVEGAEYEVLQSLTQKPPVICFEWASEWLVKNKLCVEYLKKLGYSKFHVQMLDNYTYRPDDYSKTIEDTIDILEKSKPKVDWGMIWATF